MVNWIILGVLVLLVFLFLKMRHIRHKVYVVVILLILVFGYVSISNVIKKNDLNVSSTSGMVTLGKLYFNWLGQVFANTKEITGEVIKKDWTSNLTK